VKGLGNTLGTVWFQKISIHILKRVIGNFKGQRKAVLNNLSETKIYD